MLPELTVIACEYFRVVITSFSLNVAITIMLLTLILFQLAVLLGEEALIVSTLILIF